MNPTYLLQCLDCNCNNCISMDRDFDRYKASVANHKQWQLDQFNTRKRKLTERAQFHLRNNDQNKHDHLMKEVNRMRFEFNAGFVTLNFGNCTKLHKPVSFIPDTCQPQTQHCFEHRSKHKFEEINTNQAAKV